MTPERSARGAAEALAVPRVTAALVVAAGALAYAGALDGAFLFDDLRDIVENESLHVLWPPTVAMGISFRPLVFYSFALNHAWSGHEPWSYLLVNVALHITVALALLGLLRRVLRLPRVGLGHGAADGVALATALLWVVHPLTSQAVAYTVQRAETLMALAYVLTLYSLVRADASTARRTRTSWYVACVGSFWLGLGCKEVVATAPLTLYLLDAVLLSDSWREPLRRRWPLYAALATPFVVAPTWWLLTNPERFALVDPDEDTPPALRYFTAQGLVIVEYLRLAVWPSGQNLDHRWLPGLHGRALWPAFALAATLVAGIVEGLRRRVPLAVAGAAFLIILAPTSSVFPIADYLVEHRMYLPLVACILLVVLGARRFLTHVLSRASPRRLVSAALVLAAAVPLGLLTARRCDAYESRVTMWQDVLAKAPHNPRAHFNLGVALFDEDRDANVDGALALYRRTIELQPTHAKAHNNIGGILLQRGDHARAAWHFRAALATAEETYPTLMNYAHTLLELERTAEARVVLDRAMTRLRRDPGREERRARIHLALGRCAEAEGDLAGASGSYTLALADHPALDEARDRLVSVLLMQERHAVALRVAEEGLLRDPEGARARRRLGSALAAAGRVEESVDALLAAARRADEPGVDLVALVQLCIAPASRDRAAPYARSLHEKAPDDPVLKRLVELLDRAR